MNTKKILVTGGAGFIGSHLVEGLREKYPLAHIRVLDNLFIGSEENLVGIDNIELIKGDLRNVDDVKKAMKDINIVFHIAAEPFIPDCYTSPLSFITSNVIGTFNLMWEIAHSKNIDIAIYLSTSEVYGTAQYTPMDEKHPTVPHSTYAASKLAGENIAFTMSKEHKFPLLIIRNFNTFGSKDSHPRIIPEIIRQYLKCDQMTFGDLSTRRDFLYVKDVVSGLIAAANSGLKDGEIINFASGKDIPMADLIPIIGDLLGKNKDNFKINVAENRLRPLDVGRLYGCNKKAKELLGWEPTYTLKEGLVEVIDWYKEVGKWKWEK